MRMILAAALLLGATAAPAAPFTVERVAMLMRHGVRPPTKAPPLPDGTAAAPWPRWEVAPGELTAHGGAAVRLLGQEDRRTFVRARLLPARGCPAPGTVAILSDSDQRTIATGDAWAMGLARGCPLPHEHKPQDVPDPIFSPIESGLTDYDPAAADAAVRAGLPAGGIAAVDAREQATLARLNAILCDTPQAATCGVSGPSRVLPAEATKRPKLAGALDRGSTAAQILLLEYAEGKPAQDVGWGRASAADIAQLGRLHATEFALLARRSYIAAHNLAPIARRLHAALQPGAPKVTMIVGHDTNIANMAGLFDVHWRAPGFADDDPAPGGALVATVLRSPTGARFVQLSYRVQPLDTIRRLRRGAVTRTLHIPSCDPRGDGLCPLPTFAALLDRSSRLLTRR